MLVKEESYKKLAEAVGFTAYDCTDIIANSIKDLRKKSPERGEVFVEANAYAKLLRDSQALEVIKQKLGIDSI